MAQFYNEYNDNPNLQPLVGEISWTKHIAILSKCKDQQERKFYIQATKKFDWTKDALSKNRTDPVLNQIHYSALILLFEEKACNFSFPPRSKNVGERELYLHTLHYKRPIYKSQYPGK